MKIGDIVLGIIVGAGLCVLAWLFMRGGQPATRSRSVPPTSDRMVNTEWKLLSADNGDGTWTWYAWVNGVLNEVTLRIGQKPGDGDG